MIENEVNIYQHDNGWQALHGTHLTKQPGKCSFEILNRPVKHKSHSDRVEISLKHSLYNPLEVHKRRGKQPGWKGFSEQEMPTKKKRNIDIW